MSADLNDHHPEAGRVHHLFSFSSELHGKQVEVIDWLVYACMHARDVTMIPNLVSALIARSALARRPLTREDVFTAQQRFVLVRVLERDEFALVCDNEILILERNISDVRKSLQCALLSLEGVAAKVENRIKYGDIPASDLPVLRHMELQLQGMRELVSRDDLLTSSEGIAALSQAAGNARCVHALLDALIATVTVRYRQEFVSTLHKHPRLLANPEYYKNFAPLPEGNPPFKALNNTWTLREQLVTLRHKPSLKYGPNPPTTLSLVTDFDELEIEAVAHFTAFRDFTSENSHN